MRFEELFGGAKFIAPSADSVDSPYIRTVFEAHNVKNAVITICGLGFFELFINGRKVSEDMYVPANALYRYRANADMKGYSRDVFSYRTYAVRYDVEDYIKDGNNSLVVHLGNGWYGDTGDHDQRLDYFGTVKLAYKLDISDDDGERSVISDEKHKWKQSFVLENHLYLGERQDMRQYDNMIFRSNYDDSEWENVVIADIHDCEYDLQDFPPDRITETRIPVAVRRFDGYTVYDCGINMTGFVVSECEKAGETVEINHAEELDEDGNLYTVTCAGDRKPQKDVYISDGVHEMYPRFSWHGFRYFTLTNNAKPVKACMVHADMNVTSRFKSDNEMLNWLYETYLRTQLENMHSGIPSDCPTRERLGYTGDGQLCADAALLMMDGKSFYKKWMQDIVDSQCILSGHVNHTAPFSGAGGGIGGWGSAIIHLPYVYYSVYGDNSLIKKHFPRMLSFMRYLDSRCSAGFITSEEPGNWNLGDWGFSKMDEFIIPQNYVNTYFYIRCLEEMCEMAPVVGMEEIIPSYKEKIEVSKRAMKAAYMSSEDGNYFGNYQGANCFAVALGIGDERTYENMRKKYSENPEYDTGIFATDILTGVFFDKGDAQVAYNLLTSERDLSFGNMRKNGATTLWEYMWGNNAKINSRNHPMFGAVTKYLFHGILGIRQKKGAYGYKDIVIAPAVIDGLNEYSGHIDTGSGKIGVSVKREGSGVCVTAEIPKGVTAEFVLGNVDVILKSGKSKIDVKL